MAELGVKAGAIHADRVEEIVGQGAADSMVQAITMLRKGVAGVGAWAEKLRGGTAVLQA